MPKAPVLTKTCNVCGEAKSLLEFHLQKTGAFGRKSICRECRRAEAKEYNSRPDRILKRRGQWSRLSEAQKARRKERHKANHLRRKFGLSIEEYQSMLAKQDGKCGICQKELEADTRYVHVDHCHRTGRVREILCQKCNAALGMVGDDVTILERAVNYLLKYKSVS